MRFGFFFTFWVAVTGMAVAEVAEPGFEALFDGRSLEGWDGDPQFWRVEGGVIVGETTLQKRTPESTFLIWRGGEPGDFELKVEFKLGNHNSGIQYRSFPIKGKRWLVGGYQADIAEDSQWMGVAWGEKYKKLLAGQGQKTVVGKTERDLKVMAEVGDTSEILSAIDLKGWNEYHIIARGNQVIQMINGVITAEFSEAEEERLHAGLIALQLHAGPPMKVSFRNIRLRELKAEDKKEILFFAGKKGHGYNVHEHKAGCHLLARCLNESKLDLVAQVVEEGAWPKAWVGYQKPDAIVMYCDGFDAHMAKEHQDKIQSLVDMGVGVSCLHFGVEVEPDVLGKAFLDWIGGYFEIGWSVNPFWTPEFKTFPEHPVANGVRPFSIRDEWYYHMRFTPELKNVVPILQARAPLRTLTSRKKDKNRGSNPFVMEAVKAGTPQVVAWVYERVGGGRGFGFTGGHFHENWRQDDFRKTVLNGIVWTAGMDIPRGGVSSRTPSDLDLSLNQDYPEPERK